MTMKYMTKISIAAINETWAECVRATLEEDGWTLSVRLHEMKNKINDLLDKEGEL